MEILQQYTCSDGDVRLTQNGLVIASNEGVVEICTNGEWNRVCRNDWDYRETGLVCNQLGYNIESKYTMINYYC